MEYLHIDINLEEDKKSNSMIGDIMSLKPIKGKEPVFEDDLVLSKVISKAKGEKKKKKKKKNKDDVNFFVGGELSDEENNSNEESNEYDFIDLEDLLREESEREVDGEIIDFQKNNYGKLKKEENPYKKEFAEEYTLLYNLLDEVNKFSKKIEKKYDVMESSKTRGVSKYATDLCATILGAKQNKLQIIKELSSVKKTIADLKIKAEGKEKNAASAVSNETLAVSYLQNVIKHGRGTFVNELTSDNADNIVNDIEGIKDDMSPFEYERYQETIEARLNDEDNPYGHGEEGSAYIKYENAGVKLNIKRNLDTGEWVMIALDKNNQQIYDYPVPDKESLGKVKFTDDGTHASDKYGRTYKVIEYYSEP